VQSGAGRKISFASQESSTTGKRSTNCCNLTGRPIMGKYVLGWILGVPFIVLIIVYILFN